MQRPQEHYWTIQQLTCVFAVERTTLYRHIKKANIKPIKTESNIKYYDDKAELALARSFTIRNNSTVFEYSYHQQQKLSKVARSKAKDEMKKETHKALKESKNDFKQAFEILLGHKKDNK